MQWDILGRCRQWPSSSATFGSFQACRTRKKSIVQISRRIKTSTIHLHTCSEVICTVWNIEKFEVSVLLSCWAHWWICIKSMCIKVDAGNVLRAWWNPVTDAAESCNCRMMTVRKYYFLAKDWQSNWDSWVLHQIRSLQHFFGIPAVINILNKPKRAFS